MKINHKGVEMIKMFFIVLGIAIIYLISKVVEWICSFLCFIKLLRE
jgi:hypothetical protein